MATAAFEFGAGQLARCHQRRSVDVYGHSNWQLEWQGRLLWCYGFFRLLLEIECTLIDPRRHAVCASEILAISNEAILDGNPPSIGMPEMLDPMTHVCFEQRSVLGYEGS